MYNNFYSNQRYAPQQFNSQNYPQYNYQSLVQPSVEIPQVQNNYDFYGMRVNSYEEAKNFPFNSDKPIFLLDINNSKVYIKELDKNGNPSVVTFDLVESKNGEKPSILAQEVDINEELRKLREDFENFKKTISDNEPKTNKKMKGDE